VEKDVDNVENSVNNVENSMPDLCICLHKQNTERTGSQKEPDVRDLFMKNAKSDFTECITQRNLPEFIKKQLTESRVAVIILMLCVYA